MVDPGRRGRGSLSSAGPRRKGSALLALCLAFLAACAPRHSVPRAPHCATVEAERSLAPPALDLSAVDVAPRHLRAWIELLASPPLRGRRAGEAGSDAAASALAATFSELGLAAPFPHGYCQEFSLLGAADQNVVGHLAASGAGERPAILVGAHYDGQGVTPAGRVFPGADDNASGVAALVEVARLAARRPSLPVDVAFVAFGGEEADLLGARTWAAAPTLPFEHLVLMINLDMVGRPWPGENAATIGYLPLGGEKREILTRLAEAAADANVAVRSLADLVPGLESMRSDSSVFAPRVPTLFLSTGLHADHHEPSDVVERVDLEQVERAARLVLALLEGEKWPLALLDSAL